MTNFMANYIEYYKCNTWLVTKVDGNKKKKWYLLGKGNREAGRDLFFSFPFSTHKDTWLKV